MDWNSVALHPTILIFNSIKKLDKLNAYTPEADESWHTNLLREEVVFYIIGDETSYKEGLVNNSVKPNSLG